MTNLKLQTSESRIFPINVSTFVCSIKLGVSNLVILINVAVSNLNSNNKYHSTTEAGVSMGVSLMLVLVK